MSSEYKSPLQNDKLGVGIHARDEKLVKFTTPKGQHFIEEEGYAKSYSLSQVVNIATHTFRFERADGDYEEKTVAVNRPSGAGFIVMLIDLYYAFVNKNNRGQLIERPLGQFVADVGMRGNNLVCGVRLTDINADDAVSIEVTAGVLFFN